MNLSEKLRYMGRQYSAGKAARGGGQKKHYLEEAADEIDRLRAENAALLLSAIMQWQPIETAPKDGSDVLVAGQLADDSWIMAVGRYSLDSGEVCQRGTLATGWKYWIPLPEAPNAEVTGLGRNRSNDD